MRGCYICRSESEYCGHREHRVILAEAEAAKRAIIMPIAENGMVPAQKPPERATGLKPTALTDSMDLKPKLAANGLRKPQC